MHLKHLVLTMAALAAGCSLSQSQSVASLPVVERNGGSYFEYKAEDGESLYGVAKKFGWDYDLLDSLNPGASDHLKRGSLLYYPKAGNDRSETAEAAGTATGTGRSGKMEYEVTNSTNPYEIAKLLGVTTDQLYAQNPSARKGVRPGDKITMDYSLLDSAAPVQSGSETSVSTETESNVGKSMADRFASAKNASGKPEREAVTTSPLPATDAGDTAAALTPQEEDPYSSPSTRNPLIGLDTDMLMEYTIQPGDDAALVAKNFNTTVRDIYFLNPAISEAWFPEGTVINILPGSRDQDHRTCAIKSRVRSGEVKYKVAKGDSWYGIAKSNGISEDELKEANPKVKEIKKGRKIVVPRFTVNTEWKDVVFSDPREATPEGRKEIWREVKDFDKPEKKSGNEFDLVLLTSTESADAKRDREFLRGFLLGVKGMNTPGRKIGIQVIDITRKSAVTALESDEKSGRPDVVIGTFEKNFPETLASYGKETGCAVVNVFDARSELYLTQPDMFQVLMPSEEMNSSIAENIAGSFSGRNFIFISDNASESDNYTSILKSRLTASGIKFENLSAPTSLKDKEMNSGAGYVIVSNAQSQGEIRSTLAHVAALRESYPGVRISLIGRPSWIVYAGKMGDQMADADTYLPSRFFYDEESPVWRDFKAAYRSQYNVAPTASFPPYAALGYDTARFFIGSLLRNGGDFNTGSYGMKGVEMNFDFERVSSRSGLVNTSLFWMHYSAAGTEVIQF